MSADDLGAEKGTNSRASGLREDDEKDAIVCCFCLFVSLIAFFSLS